MPVVYVREPHEPSRRELLVDHLDALPVKDLKEIISQRLHVPPEEQMLMYAGRVLKQGKTLGQYNIVHGATLFLMKKKGPAQPKASSISLANVCSPEVISLLWNKRVHHILSQVIANPTMLEQLVATSFDFDPMLLDLLGNSQLTAAIGDPDTLISYLEGHTFEAEQLNKVFEAIRSSIAKERGCDPHELPEEDLIGMMEQVVEHSRFVGQEMEEGEELADAQDQMYEHSQALLAHSHSQSAQSQPSSTEQHSLSAPASLASQQLPPPPAYQGQGEMFVAERVPVSGSSQFTHNMLATALSAISSQTPSSGVRTLTVQPPGEAPRSLPTSTGEPEPLSGGPQSLPMIPSSGQADSTHFGSGPSSLTAMSSSPSGGIGISASSLQTALFNVQAQTHSQRPQARSGQLSPRRRFRNQMYQLHAMGITDDSACLHALEATNGNLQAALELLMGTGMQH